MLPMPELVYVFAKHFAFCLFIIPMLFGVSPQQLVLVTLIRHWLKMEEWVSGRIGGWSLWVKRRGGGTRAFPFH